MEAEMEKTHETICNPHAIQATRRLSISIARAN